MTNVRGNSEPGSEPDPGLDRDPEDGGRLNSIPDLMRRALSIGLSGFFMTEEAVRRALGDTLPKDWIDFAVDQSERTRAEFLDRLSFEIGQSLERIDLVAVLSELLEGRTLEVKAQIRLGSEPGKKPRLEVEAANLGEDVDGPE